MKFGNIDYYLIDLVEYLQVILDTTLVFLRKDMLEVVFKLLAANSADYVICSRFWLLDATWVLLFFVFFAFHIGYVIVIFLVQKLRILLSEFSLFLKLEN